jgi:hypothetical protein
LKIGEILSPEINAVDPMFCIFNLGSISQAGRRGFDPRPPLQTNQPFLPQFLKGFFPALKSNTVRHTVALGLSLRT